MEICSTLTISFIVKLITVTFRITNEETSVEITDDFADIVRSEDLKRLVLEKLVSLEEKTNLAIKIGSLEDTVNRSSELEGIEFYNDLVDRVLKD